MASCVDEESLNYKHNARDIELIDLLEANGLSLEGLKMPASNDFDSIPQDPNNPITTEKVLLGRFLFHETALGINPKDGVALQTYSCASCHNASAGFQAGTIQGIGDGGAGFGEKGEGRIMHPDYNSTMVDVQPLRSPSALNIGYQKNVLWNGQFGATGVNAGTESQWTEDTPKEVNNLGFEGVETQAIAGLTVHRLDLDNNFIQNTAYKTLFDAAFPEVAPIERYTIKNAGLAIAAYERTILSNQAPFQKWLQGNSRAMTLNQKEGAVLFFGKANCVDCHNSPALNDMNFYALGMKDLNQETEMPIHNLIPNDPANLGRGSFTGNPDDNFKFKTPQLYNLKDSPFYGHGGSFRSIVDVIRYKNAGSPENSTVPEGGLAEGFKPLGLSDEEIVQIKDFIESGLYDPNLRRYQPSNLPSGFCTPNNDPASKSDLDCN